MILWWGKKKEPDPKTGETPVEPLKPGETPASPLTGSPIASLDQQIFGNAPIAQPEPELDDDPIGLRKAAERIAAERAATIKLLESRLPGETASTGAAASTR